MGFASLSPSSKFTHPNPFLERERERGMENDVVKVEVRREEEKDKVGTMAKEEEEVGSSLTMERVAAAKQYIESHYKAQMKHIQERKER